jgi:uncharacterized membrane protein YadS
VVLLAPIIALVSVWRRRRARAGLSGTTRPPLVPLFVAGFLAAVCVRSAGVLPAWTLDHSRVAQSALLAAGMFGLGAAVRLRSLLRASGSGLVAGLLTTLTIAGLSLAGVLIIG